MIRFTISVSKHLNDWLELQAIRNNRSKGSQAATYLEQAMSKNWTLDTICCPPIHIFDKPIEVGEVCRCGLAVFGGQVDG